jgi:hypothetical protein
MKRSGLLLYEINEVPWRVVDGYLARRPARGFRELLKRGHQLTTMTKDEGELHPWSTWPTVHRGVYNTAHNIRFINQEINTEYPPVWQILDEHGVKAGVFGSLQSWPVPANGHYAFYVPDTFAQDAHTLPRRYEAFQGFNLKQTQRDGAIAKDLKLREVSPRDLLRLLRTGLRLSTATQLGLHLMRERVNKDHRTYRSVQQGRVAFDFFMDALDRYKPEYASFFTNHVAGMMHRYWKQAFPEDFPGFEPSVRDQFLRQNVMRAMDIADKQLTRLLAWCDRNHSTLLVASSMGQQPIDRGEYLGELRIEDVDRFVRALGFTKPYKNNLAMQPDFAFSFETTGDLIQFRDAVAALVDPDGNALFYFKESGNTLNINLCNRNESLIKGKKVYRKGAAPIDFAEAGLSVIMRDMGTAYHQPKGIAIFCGPKVHPDSSRKEVESTSITSTILNNFGIQPPPYMPPALSI